MRNYYVIIGKNATCPQHSKEIVLNAKYRFTGNPNNDYEVCFSKATCPIVENPKLHEDEQNEEYKDLDCPVQNCPLLDDFPKMWDSRNPL